MTFKKANYPIFLDLEKKKYRIDDAETYQEQFLVQDPNGYLFRFMNLPTFMHIKIHF